VENKKMKKFYLGLFLILAAAILPQKALATGLSTTFSEVSLEDLETGKSYSTREVASLPLEVVNTSDEPVDLKIELLMPETSELKEGYAPIPDLGWVSLAQLNFSNIQPRASAETDVVITIPADAQYKGKKYQVFIWSHTVGRKIGVGLKSKLLITIKE
jgi:hypothetical protein